MAYTPITIPTGFDFQTDAPKPKPKPAPASKKPKKFKQIRKQNSPNALSENAGISADIMAPAMLILKRRGIRQYPDGQRVALYYNERFKMIFTVPYGPSRLSPYNASTPVMGVK